MASCEDSVSALKKIIAEEVFVRGKARSIMLPTGEESGWLFDFRRILLKPSRLNLLADIFWETHKDKYPFQVGGMEVAAVPLLAAIVMKSIERGRPMNGFFIRKSRKKDGLLQAIEGEITEDPIILVDDLISSGQSLMRQLEVLDAAGKRVSQIFTFIHFRELHEYEFVKQRDVPITSLFGLPDFGIPYIAPRAFSPRSMYDIVWRFAGEQPNYFYVVPKSTPVLDEKRVYFGNDSGVFWALHQEDGSVAWSFKTGRDPLRKGIFSAPALHGGIVYFGAYDGNVYALDTRDGKKVWVYDDADWVGSSPTLAPDLGLLFIGLEFGLLRKRGGIAALDMKTGGKKWEFGMPEFTHGTPAYCSSKKIVAIGSNDGKLYMFNAKRGDLLWTFQAGGEIKAAPVFDEQRGLVLFGSLDGKLYVVDMQTGKEVFAYQTEYGIFSTPLLRKNDVFFSSLDKRLYSLNLDTRTLNWDFQTRGRIFSSPSFIDNGVYIGSNDGRLYEIDPESGRERGYFQTAERITNKVVYNEKTKRFFLMTFANEVYCLTERN